MFSSTEKAALVTKYTGHEVNAAWIDQKIHGGDDPTLYELINEIVRVEGGLAREALKLQDAARNIQKAIEGTGILNVLGELQHVRADALIAARAELIRLLATHVRATYFPHDDGTE